MEPSILTSTKRILGLAYDYTAFDMDVVTHINAAFSVLNQLGVLDPLVVIEDAQADWASLGLTDNQLGLVKTYVYLKTRLAFDPPTTSFMIEAVEKQIREYEWRLNVNREEALVEEV